MNDEKRNNKRKILIIILLLIPLLLLCLGGSFILSKFIGVENQEESEESGLPESVEEEDSGNVELYLFQRETSIEDWALPSNILIETSLSESEQEQIRVTLYNVLFPVEQLGEISIGSSSSYFEGYQTQPLAVAFENPDTIAINRNHIDEQSFTHTLVHELGHIVTYKLKEHKYLDASLFREVRGIDIPYSTEWSEQDIEDFAEVFVKLYYDEESVLGTVYEQEVFENDLLLIFFNDVNYFVKSWPFQEEKYDSFVTEVNKQRLYSKFGDIYLTTYFPENWNIDRRYWDVYEDIKSKGYESPVFGTDFENCSQLNLYPTINSTSSPHIDGAYYQYFEFQMMELDLCIDPIDSMDYVSFETFLEQLPEKLEDKRRVTQAQENLITFSNEFTTFAVNNTGGVTLSGLENRYGKSSDQVLEFDGEVFAFTDGENYYHFRLYGYFERSQLLRVFEGLEKQSY